MAANSCKNFKLFRGEKRGVWEVSALGVREVTFDNTCTLTWLAVALKAPQCADAWRRGGLLRLHC